ncbi:MAG: oxidoreductase [Pseudomonadales bacterium]
MIRVGIIGYGFSAATFHIPFIQTSPEFELSAICSSRPETVNQDFPELDTFKSLETMLDSGKVELAIITSTNEYHYEMAKRCLERGIHVVLEKPMVTSSNEATALIELTQTKSAIFSVFQNRRWDGDFQTLQSLIEQGDLGDIRCFESRWDRFRPNATQRWRELPGPGSGIWWDLGPHLVDQVLVLFGMPNAVTARILQLRENAQAEDYFHVLLHYQDLEVILHSSPFAAGPNMRFHLQGSSGSYIKSGLDPQEKQLKSGMLPTDPAFGLEQEDSGFLYDENNKKAVPTKKGNYSEYFARLANAIEHNEEPPVTVFEAADVIRVIEQAAASSRNGCTINF